MRTAPNDESAPAVWSAAACRRFALQEARLLQREQAPAIRNPNGVLALQSQSALDDVGEVA